MPLERQPDKTKNKLDAHLGSRGLRIVFIPWDSTEGYEWTKKTEQWNFVSTKKYQIVHYRPGEKNSYILQANTQADSVIYIRGHGNPGVPYIQVKVFVGDTGVQEERKILITEACQRLIETGLNPTFKGVIKFFHCYSGTILTDAGYQKEVHRLDSLNQTTAKAYKQGMITKTQKENFWREIYPNKSIARNGADYMRKNGFKQCLYYGYLGPLQSKYEDDGTGNFHKGVEITGLKNGPAGLVGLQSTRASNGRIQV